MTTTVTMIHGKRVLVFDGRQPGEVHFATFRVSASTPRHMREALARSLDEGKTIFENVDFDNEITDGLVDSDLEGEESELRCEECSEYFDKLIACDPSDRSPDRIGVTGTPFDFVISLTSA